MSDFTTSPPATRMGASLRTVAALALVVATLPATAAPLNDAIADAEVIASLPFNDVETSIHQATSVASDPHVFCRTPVGKGGNSVWYRYSTGANPEFLSVSSAGSDYETLIAVYSGTPGNLSRVAGGCNDDGVAGSITLAQINGLLFAAETTFYIEVVQEVQSATPRMLQFSLAAAPVYIVTKTADTLDGSCTLADCSLREAISASNAEPGAVIVADGTYTITRTGQDEDANATGDFDVLVGMAIYGQSREQTVINANGVDRSFQVNPAGTAQPSFLLSNLSVRGGFPGSFGSGAGLRIDGQRAALTIERCSFLNNVGLGGAGAIFAASVTSIQDSIFSGNQASAYGGALYLPNPVEAEIRNSTFTNNSGNGGAIASQAALTLINSTISGNQTGGFGGGIRHLSSTQLLQIRSSTVAENSVIGDGHGGGIYADMQTSNPPLIENSVLAGNTTEVGIHANCNFIDAPGNYSHSDKAECLSAGNGNVKNVPVTLLPLSDTLGGSIPVHAFTSGSPLVDSANPVACVDQFGEPLETDQRGEPHARHADGNFDGTSICDKGAFEAMPQVLLFANGFD